MQRVSKAVFPIFRGVLVVGFGIRMILGLLWIVTNITEYQYFGQEPGLLYPLLLKVFEGMGRFLHIPYYCIVYLFQIAALSGAVWMLLGNSCFLKEKRIFRIFVLMSVLTDLVVAQCVLSLLPNALLAACAAAGISLCGRIYEKRGKGCAKEVTGAVILWITAFLLKKEYILFGICLVFFTGIGIFMRTERVSEKKTVWSVISGMVLLTAIAILSLKGFQVLEQKELIEKQATDFHEAVFSRFVWNTMFGLSGGATEEMLMVLSPDEVLEAGAYADSVFLETIPLLKERLGAEGTVEFMDTAVKAAWKNHRSVILHDIAWDMAGYTIPPVIAGLQMKGKGFRSLSLRNYEILGRKTPLIGKYYMDYYVCWFPCGVFLGAVCSFLQKILRTGLPKQKNEKTELFLLFAGMGFSLLTAVWYTMQGAGFMDYKKTIICMLTWNIWIFWNIRAVRTMAESDTEKEKQDGGRA